MKPELKLSLSGDTLTIREGKALELKEPIPVRISGTIGCVSEFLNKRGGLYSSDNSHIVVDRDKMTMKLFVNESDHYRTVITGSITPSPEFTKWGINDPEKQYNSQELALKIKMNRYQFISLEKAAELVNVFQNLRAKVQREVEHSDNSRGNVKKSFSQVVTDMTIPEKFEIITPLFKGDEKRKITVEIVIDPESLKCTLVSPDAVDIIARVCNMMIDTEIEIIEKFESRLPIFEV